MAARHRRWIAIGGATAAVAIGAWATVATGTPTLTAPALSRQPVTLTWSDTGAAAYTLTRTLGMCGHTTGNPAQWLLVPPATTFLDSGFPDGQYCYEITSTYPGDSPPPASSQVDVLVDNTPPNVSIVSPTSTFVSGTVGVNVSASDPGGPLPVSPSVSTVPASNITGTSWVTTGTGDGQYTLNASAQDAAGNVGRATPRTVVVDNNPPSAFSASALPSFPGSPQIFWGDSSDASGVSFRIVRNNGLSDTIVPGPLTSGWTDTPSPPVGTYTYTVQAVDALGHVRSANPLTVRVTSASVTSPQNVTAPSPTNTTPHLAWQRPVSFLVTGYQVLRDGALVKELDAGALSFDDAAVPGQGLHSYVIRAKSGSDVGVPSAPVAVVYDTEAPALASASATPNPDGSVSIIWPPASDPEPGAGLSGYVVRRGPQSAPPAGVGAGIEICKGATIATGCLDASAQNAGSYGYSVFALDGAGNVARQVAGARAADTVAPAAVTGFRGSVGPSNAHLIWDVPARQDASSDIAGYRLIQLTAGVKKPANPKDGLAVCPGLGSRDGDCFVQNLPTGKKVTFAVYAYDEVPNYSPPALVTIVPRGDGSKPGLPTKVRLKRVGARFTMTWVSPRDRDLSHFRVTLFDNGPAVRPAIGKAIVTGRVLRASFRLKARQIVYVNLFAIDLSGNFSRVTKLIVMPDKIVAPKKQKAKKGNGGAVAAPKKT